MNTPAPLLDAALTASIIRRLSRVIAGALVGRGWVADSDAEFWSGVILAALTEGWALYRDWRARTSSNAETLTTHATTGNAAPDPKP